MKKRVRRSFEEGGVAQGAKLMEKFQLRDHPNTIATSRIF
jgi:hypothetical protein